MGGGAVRALWPAMGLVVWAAHFGSLYATHAVACERGLATGRLLGLEPVAAIALLLTGAALLALVLLAVPALRAAPASASDGGEAEPGFRRWLTIAIAGAAAIGILFEALPAMMLPSC